MTMHASRRVASRRDVRMLQSRECIKYIHKYRDPYSIDLFSIAIRFENRRDVADLESSFSARILSILFIFVCATRSRFSYLYTYSMHISYLYTYSIQYKYIWQISLDIYWTWFKCTLTMLEFFNVRFNCRYLLFYEKTNVCRIKM